MTENVLSNIFESLSLDDVAAAETQLDEWFDAITAPTPVVEAEEEEKEDDKEDVCEAESEEEDESKEDVKESEDDSEEEKEELEEAKDEAEDEEEKVEESIDPAFADLVEQFKGFSVVDKLDNKEGAQVGNADSVEVNAKSPVPNIKAAKRVGGSPVEVKAEEHKGFEAEAAPAVADAKVKNPAPKTEPKEVPADGDKGALLNKEEGKGNDVSPIGSKSRD